MEDVYCSYDNHPCEEHGVGGMIFFVYEKVSDVEGIDG